jgi:sugar phosphate isomerase/epimerase
VLSLAKQFRIPSVILVPGKASANSSASLESVQDEIRALVLRATGNGLNVLYEFIGFPDSAFPTLRQAFRLAEAIGIPLVLDTFHLAVSHTPRSAIASLPASAIGLVHLSDAYVEGKAIEELQDDSRVLPGEEDLPPLRAPCGHSTNGL